MAPETKPSSTVDAQVSDERYRYIGFDVYPKHVPPFWKSEQEQQQHLDHVRSGTGVSSLERENSLLHDESMTATDRIVLTIAGSLLAATTLLPWVSFRTIQGTDFSMSWGGALVSLSGGLGTAFAGGVAVGLSALLALIMLVGGPLVGLWIVFKVWGKTQTPDEYLTALRLPLKVGKTFLYAGVAIGLLSFLGGQIPGYGSWGLIDPGDGYGLGTLLSIVSYGPFSIMALGLVVGVKAGDL